LKYSLIKFGIHCKTVGLLSCDLLQKQFLVRATSQSEAFVIFRYSVHGLLFKLIWYAIRSVFVNTDWYSMLSILKKQN